MRAELLVPMGIAAVGVVVSLGLGLGSLWQARKLNLFDKRFAVYRVVQEFAVFILRKGYDHWELLPNEDDSQRRARFEAIIEPPEYPTHSEFLQLQDSVERAEFLFPSPTPRWQFWCRRSRRSEVGPYLKEFKDKARKHWELCLRQAENKIIYTKAYPGPRPPDADVSSEITELLKYFAEAQEKRTKEVFRPHLQN